MRAAGRDGAAGRDVASGDGGVAGSAGPGRPALAWAAHAYTATGLAVAAWIAVLIVRGTGDAFRSAFLWMAVAVLVDATDGWLARRAKVREVLPWFDGRRLDDIIDFHTYTSLPLLLIWRADLLPGGADWVLLVPLLASAYGFSRKGAKTEDGFFLGFPSYWNVVAFYLFFLRPEAWITLTILLTLAGLTFVPFKYLNASRPGPLRIPTILFGASWGLLILAILAGAATGRVWVLASLAFPAYYMIASWAISLGERTRRRETRSTRRGDPASP